MMAIKILMKISLKDEKTLSIPRKPAVVGYYIAGNETETESNSGI